MSGRRRDVWVHAKSLWLWRSERNKKWNRDACVAKIKKHNEDSGWEMCVCKFERWNVWLYLSLTHWRNLSLFHSFTPHFLSHRKEREREWLDRQAKRKGRVKWKGKADQMGRERRIFDSNSSSAATTIAAAVIWLQRWCEGRERRKEEDEITFRFHSLSLLPQ